jgi:CRISPR/Cas system CSM-associated protein Csm3 (group 7 of RAMP superfamily)
MLKQKSWKATLITKEPFRIGAKQEPLSGADNPITRLGGKLVIPGTTVKGALRSEVERFLIDTYYEAGKWKQGFEAFRPCIPGAELSRDEEKLVDSGKYRDKIGACHYPCNPKKCGDRNHSICPACYLFGSQGLVGFVKVPFLYAEGTPTDITGTRIDRARKTVFEKRGRGALYTYEVVPDGVTFSGTLSVLLEDTVLGWKLGEPRDLGEERTLGDLWLKGNKGKMDGKAQDEFIETYIIARLRTLNVLGGYKSKGFGNVEISVEQV